MILQEILVVKGGTVYTIDPAATVQDVIRELVHHNVGALLVCRRDPVEGEQLVGIITERDILRFCAWGKKSPAETRVEEVMSTRLITASPQDQVETVMGQMTRNRIRHLPVLSQGRLVGIVSIGDVVKSQHDHLAMENQFMKDYIRG